MKISILPPLTREYLLSKIPQEMIMKMYTGVEVTEETLLGNSFCSPFREDKTYTCNYWYSVDKRGITRLKLRDWGTTQSYDIFDCASFSTGISIKSSQGFKLLMMKIARDFKIHQFQDDTEAQISFDKALFKQQPHKATRIFKVIPRALNTHDGRYWFNKYGIGSDTIKIANIIPVEKLYITDRFGEFQLVYVYNPTDPGYAYFGGYTETGIIKWKVYFPYRQKGKGNKTKFISNYAFIQGLKILLPSQIGVITKSYKDVLVLRAFGIAAIGIPSETYIMDKDEFFDFKNKHDVICTLFDNDYTGIKLANQYKKLHNCTPFIIPKAYGVKDLSDFRDVYGEEKTRKLIYTIIDSYKEELDKITKYNTLLKWV